MYSSCSAANVLVTSVFTPPVDSCESVKVNLLMVTEGGKVWGEGLVCLPVKVRRSLETSLLMWRRISLCYWIDYVIDIENQSL